ncbi:hypothetical protein [Thiolapillus sp.]
MFLRNLCLLALALFSPVLPAQQPVVTDIPVPGALQPVKADAGIPEFVRLKFGQNKQPLSLQVAVVRFVPRNGNSNLHVDLISAVHIGESAYYQTINALFPHYDAVLYELVAPQGTRIVRDGNERKGVVSGLQGWMGDALGMRMQLEEVDYTLPNLVHADLSPEEFSQSMKERNESVAGLIGRAWIAGMGQQYSTRAALSQARLFKNLLSGNRELALKTFAAEQMMLSAGLDDAIEGPDGSTLVSVRNKKALQVLRRQIAAGKQKLAIFYGVAHMPDIARRLVAEFDLVPDWIGWIDAWNLRQGPDVPSRGFQTRR